MALEFTSGGEAKYDPKNFTTTAWCKTPVNDRIISSSFGSCVGLVLWAKGKGGAVAHFPGTLGDKAYADQVVSDTVDVLAGLNMSTGTGWTMWVFGGSSLSIGSDFSTSTTLMTQSLIKKVREVVLDKCPGVTESNVTKDKYASCKEVSLYVSTGLVTFLFNETPTLTRKSSF